LKHWPNGTPPKDNMKFIHTGVPPFYSNETPDRTGVYIPNFTPRSANNEDQNSNQSLIAHIAIYHYLYCKSFELKAYVQAFAANASLYNSLVMNGGGVA